MLKTVKSVKYEYEFVGGVRRSPTQALTSLEARVTSDRRKHIEK